MQIGRRADVDDVDIGVGYQLAKAPIRRRDLVATGKLDDMIAGLTGPRTEVDDPDGLVRFTLSDDERLLSLFIDDAVRTSLNNLGLEHRLNDQFAADHEAMRLSRKQFWGRCE